MLREKQAFVAVTSQHNYIWMYALGNNIWLDQVSVVGFLSGGAYFWIKVKLSYIDFFWGGSLHPRPQSRVIERSRHTDSCYKLELF